MFRVNFRLFPAYFPLISVYVNVNQRILAGLGKHVKNM